MSVSAGFAEPDRNRLTRLASLMLALAGEGGVPGLRAVVMLATSGEGPEDQAVAAAGYGEGALPADLLADITDHVIALAASYGVRLTITVGPS